MKNKTNILITALPFYSLSHDIKKLFKKKNITYKFLQKNKDINDIDIENYDAIIAGVENYDKKVILKASRLKLISRVGIGTDSINLEFCKKQNIKVFKVKSPNEAVAEYSISAIISSLRNFPIMNYNLHNKIWKPELGKSLSESTVGIIGYGKIGKLIANYLLKLKVGKILVHDLRKFNKNKNIHFCNKKRIFEESDIVSLNISLNDKTHNYVSFKEINQINKPISILNTSRGKIINENALLHGLKNNKIKNLFLDVFNEEPYSGKIIKFQNCMITPHISSFTNKARREMETQAIKNLLNNI
jgi:D-3-phosphoglycerate dehydrogenase / 2-oxoglutarate reductase|tara:strand:- start:4467 stop:5372 length:906 start_codon:yes stop_codon:yes gene_type:complete